MNIDFDCKNSFFFKIVEILGEKSFRIIYETCKYFSRKL